jgi:hypothetical protein
MPEGDQEQTGQQNTGIEGQGDQGEQNQGDVLTFDSWYEKQDEAIRTLIDTHIIGLKTALTSEREQRKTFEAQLREAAKKAEKGSEMEAALTAMAEKAADAERQARFYEVAGAAGITNLRLAWIVAKEAGLIDRQGIVNMEALKSQFPELFRGPAAGKGNAGAGIGQTGGPKPDMNAFIRRSAGMI